MTLAAAQLGPDSARSAPRRRPALVALSQGSRAGQADAGVAELLGAVARAEPGLHVVSGVVDVQQPDVAPALAALEPGEPAVVVPLMLATGHHVHQDLATELASDSTRTAALASALAPDDALVAVLATRLGERGLTGNDVVVLAALGSSDHRAVRDCIDTGRRLAGQLSRTVTVGFTSAAVPRLTTAIETMRGLHPGSRVVVARYQLSPGRYADATATAGGDLATETLLVPGRRPPRELVDLVLRRYHEAAAAIAAP